MSLPAFIQSKFNSRPHRQCIALRGKIYFREGADMDKASDELDCFIKDRWFRDRFSDQYLLAIHRLLITMHAKKIMRRHCA